MNHTKETTAIIDQLARRREAAQRMTPLATGYRDPLTSRPTDAPARRDNARGRWTW